MSSKPDTSSTSILSRETITKIFRMVGNVVIKKVIDINHDLLNEARDMIETTGIDHARILEDGTIQITAIPQITEHPEMYQILGTDRTPEITDPGKDLD